MPVPPAAPGRTSGGGHYRVAMSRRPAGALTEGVPTVTIRPRRPADVPGLVALLGEQQPASRYPLRWPLPFPVEQFLVRATEERAWVAQVGDVLAGHIAVTTPDGEMAEAFGRVCPGHAVAEVAVLFSGSTFRGSGVGGRLLDTAVAAIRHTGRTPALDVLPAHSSAVAVYRHRGWVEVGRMRPAWLPADQPDVLLMVLPDPAEPHPGHGRRAGPGPPPRGPRPSA